jgi:hypothetical protein
MTQVNSKINGQFQDQAVWCIRIFECILSDKIKLTGLAGVWNVVLAWRSVGLPACLPCNHIAGDVAGAEADFPCKKRPGFRLPWAVSILAPAAIAKLVLLPCAGLLGGGFVWGGSPGTAAGGGGQTGGDPMARFAADVLPVLETYCYDCHGEGMTRGGLALDRYETLASMIEARDQWKNIRLHIDQRLMPPPDEDQPDAGEISTVLAWIDEAVFPVDPANPDPGRVTVRRLNRVEYAHTIRDLLGVEVNAASLPPDDSGYGFDNIGDVLTLAPAHLERYHQLAVEALGLALDPVDPPERQPRVVEGDGLRGDGNPGEGGRLLFTNGRVLADIETMLAGRYRVSVRAAAQQAGDEPAKLRVQVGERVLGEAAVAEAGARPVEKSFETRFEPGRQRIEVHFLNDFYDERAPRDRRDRNLIVRQVRVEGPLDLPPPPPPATRARLLPDGRAGEDPDAQARRILKPFLGRAFRRVLAPGELERYAAFAAQARKDGMAAEAALRLALEAALVSPDFLFRELSAVRAGAGGGVVEDVPDLDLATRLSYFLWSSMPDDALLAQAAAGRLRGEMAGTVKRMMADPKAAALVDRFFLQWLRVLDLDHHKPDGEAFPAFNAGLRQAMREETRLFCRHLIAENRPVEELITAEYTFANEVLAGYYGLPGVRGPEFRKVALGGSGRRGLLTHGAVLAITSHPTRTSPVNRGKWVLETLLDQPPPPPPPTVPSLESNSEIPADAPLRLRLEAHQADPACAACHRLMDGIGFSFEHFDAVGRRRETDQGQPIDSRGTLASGEAFASPAELAAVLAGAKRDDFHRALAAKLLTFAIGRGLDYYDKPAVDGIVAAARAGGGTFRAFIQAVVESIPFQKRKRA